MSAGCKGTKGWMSSHSDIQPWERPTGHRWHKDPSGAGCGLDVPIGAGHRTPGVEDRPEWVWWYSVGIHWRRRKMDDSVSKGTPHLQKDHNVAGRHEFGNLDRLLKTRQVVWIPLALELENYLQSADRHPFQLSNAVNPASNPESFAM